MKAIHLNAKKTVYIADSEGDIGSKGPFYIVYNDEGKSDRYGWFCSHCDSLKTAMDPMGRIECTDCGNFRKPTEWDAAHE